MINFKTVRWKNLLSSGNKYTEIQLDRNQTTLSESKKRLIDKLNQSKRNDSGG
jgi:hypothetical protein